MGRKHRGRAQDESEKMVAGAVVSSIWCHKWVLFPDIRSAGQLIRLSVTELERMVKEALNSMKPEPSPIPESGIPEILVSSLTVDHRKLRNHSIKMLSQTPDLKRNILVILLCLLPFLTQLQPNSSDHNPSKSSRT
jgi:hypothetical protein